MASLMLSSTTPTGLSFLGSGLHDGRKFQKMGFLPSSRIHNNSWTIVTKCSVSASRPTSQPRFMQAQKGGLLVL